MKSPLIRSGGFSLVELLVVLIILGLIGAMVVPSLMGQTEGAKAKAAKGHVQSLSMAVDNFYLDTGSAPDSLEDLVREPGSVTGWNGPYVRDSLLTDPWGEKYVYRYPGQHLDYDIYSRGADKSEGGEGTAADIGNWQ